MPSPNDYENFRRQMLGEFEIDPNMTVAEQTHREEMALARMEAQLREAELRMVQNTATSMPLATDNTAVNRQLNQYRDHIASVRARAEMHRAQEDVMRSLREQQEREALRLIDEVMMPAEEKKEKNRGKKLRDFIDRTLPNLNKDELLILREALAQYLHEADIKEQKKHPISLPGLK